VKLPNGERAELGTKLEDYCLNPFHRQGQNKAYVFESVLGITLTNADVLRKAIQQAAAVSEDAIRKGNNGYGDVYQLRLRLSTAKGTATVLTGWIVRRGEDFPRLTTCFIV